MTWFKGIHDLAYSVQRLGGAGGAAYQEDWLSLGANLGAAGGKGLWYLRDKFPKLVEGLAKPGPTPTPTFIVDAAMVALSGLDLLNGFWAPDRGNEFAAGSLEFENLRLTLELAKPDPAQWDGDAAKAYATLNNNLQNLAVVMRELDSRMRETVEDHAGKVQKAHQVIALALMALVLAQGVALLLWAWPVLGPKVSVTFQISTVISISATVLQYEQIVLDSSASKSKSMGTLAGEYKMVVDRAATSDTFAVIKVPGAERAGVSNFGATADGISEASGFSGIPSIAQLARMSTENASADECAVVDALLGDGPATRATAPGTVAVTPGSTSPVAAGSTGLSGQGSASAAQGLRIGAGQQPASPAQRARGATTPTDDEARKRTAEFAAAGPATVGAESAPVDVAAPERASDNRVF